MHFVPPLCGRIQLHLEFIVYGTPTVFFLMWENTATHLAYSSGKNMVFEILFFHFPGKDCGFPGRPSNGTTLSTEKFFYPGEEVSNSNEFK